MSYGGWWLCGHVYMHAYEVISICSKEVNNVELLVPSLLEHCLESCATLSRDGGGGVNCKWVGVNHS